MLSADAIAQLRDAIHACMADERAASVELHTAITAAAAEAAARGMPVERLVVLVKEVWDGMLREISGSHSSDNAELRDTIVRSVIKAYYVQ